MRVLYTPKKFERKYSDPSSDIGAQGRSTTETAPPADLPRAVMMLASLEAKVTDLYLAATTPESDAGERVSAGEAEALRGAVQQLITHAERLRAALKVSEV